MKRTRSWLLRIAAVLLLAVPSPALAQAGAERAPLVGVIDIQAVLRESIAVKALAEQIEAGRQAAQQTMVTREETLRAADLNLAQRRTSLTPDEYQRERNSLEAEGVALQREMRAERRRMDQLFSQGMAEVQQVLLAISQEIARERNLDLVLAKTTVIIVKPQFDLTEEALNRLHARLTAVSSQAPAN